MLKPSKATDHAYRKELEEKDYQKILSSLAAFFRGDQYLEIRPPGFSNGAFEIRWRKLR